MNWAAYQSRITGSYRFPPDVQGKDWAGLKAGASLSSTGMHEVIWGQAAPLDPPFTGNKSLTSLATEVEVTAANSFNPKAFIEWKVQNLRIGNSLC